MKTHELVFFSRRIYTKYKKPEERRAKFTTLKLSAHALSNVNIYLLSILTLFYITTTQNNALPAS